MLALTAGMPLRAGESRFFALPMLAYAPETSLMFAAGGVLSFDTLPGARRSQVSVVAAYTLKHQFVVSLTPEVSFGDWELLGTSEVVRYPDSIFPVGNDAPAAPEAVVRFGFSTWPTLLRRFGDTLRLGGRLNLGRYEYLERQAGSLLDRTPFVVSDGAPIAGVGPIAVWDSRDNTFAPRAGTRHEVAATFYETSFGAVADYAIVSADLRWYLSLGPHGLAFNAYGRSALGDVPYEDLSRLGGSNLMRGYFEGRRRDRHLVAAQVEYRSPFWWRFGAVGFVGAGRVAKSLAALRLDGLAVAGGLGLRFVIIPEDHADMRLDAALSREGDFSFYLNVGEAF